jgi:hypothetical protein
MHHSPVKLPRRRWWLLAALVVAFAAVLVWRARQPGDLERHLARLRAEGIPTTLAELDAWYPAVPDAENAGKLVLEAASGFRTTGDPALELDFSKRPGRTNTPPPDLLAADRAYLAANADTLAAIHAALTHPHSRYPVDFKLGINAKFSHLSAIKDCFIRLSICAEMAAENGQPKVAMQCLSDQLRLTQTLQQEPNIISFLTQVACTTIATKAAERVFLRSTLPDEDLAGLQESFRQAAVGQSCEPAIVGELCQLGDFLRRPIKEIIQLADPFEFGGMDRKGVVFQIRIPTFGLWLYCLSGLHRRDLREVLEYLSQARQIARLPWYQRVREMQLLGEDQFDRLQGRYLIFATDLLPNARRLMRNDIGQYAVLRCAEVACAVERWRLAHAGALPPSLDALVPQFLAAVPEDPMDGKALKFRPRPKGFVVYSIGEDGTDDGGKGPPHGTGGPGHWDYTFVVER